MRKLNLLQRTQRSVLPTTTTLVTVRVNTYQLLSLQVKNLDLTQTLNCVIHSRLTEDDDYAASALPDLQGIAPGETRKVDIDIRSVLDVKLTGQASGLGLECTVSGLLTEGA